MGDFVSQQRDVRFPIPPYLQYIGGDMGAKPQW